MKFAQFLTRLVVVVFICGLMAFANVVPAIASQNNPNKGLEQLPNIQMKTDNAAKAGPYPSSKLKSNAKQGLNEIQGTADIDKMNRVGDEDTLPAVRQAEKSLDKVGDKINSAKDNTENGVTSALDKAGDAANYVKDVAGEAINSLAGKAADTAETIKSKAKS
jgi:vacuolar-type H+-ATPase subunit H